MRSFLSLSRLRSSSRQFHTTRSAAADFASYGKTASATTATSTTSTSTPSDSSSDSYTYTKQIDSTPEPRTSHSGTRTYVVSPKESASYDVPGGAYGSSDPYLTPSSTPAPQTSAAAGASTAPGPAHPNTTSRVPHNPDGVGASSAVRFRSAPGTKGTNTLRDRNPGPSEVDGRLGNSEAWKHRK